MGYQGTHFEEITDDLKEKVLELVANGYTRQEAAKALGASPRQLRACCSAKSHRYDPVFAAEYARITEPDGEHIEGLAERLEEAGLDRAINRGSDRLLEKYSIIYDRRWAIHRPQSMQINFNKTEQLAVILPEMSEEEILQLRQRIENNMRQIGPPDIDAP